MMLYMLILLACKNGYVPPWGPESPPHSRFLEFLKNWDGFRGLVLGIVEGWMLCLRANSPESTPPPFGPEGGVALYVFPT